MLDYGAAHNQRSEAVASFSVALTIDLAGLDVALARMERIEECLGRFRSLAHDESLEGVRMRVGPVVPTVDRLDRFREPLLQRHLEPLRAVAALPNVPAQFDPLATRCTSTGAVSILERTLSGVTIDVDFTCTGTSPLPREVPGGNAALEPL